MRISTIFIILSGLGLILLTTSAILSVVLSNQSIIKGDCYDGYQNKINGLTCDVPNPDYPSKNLINLLTLMGAITFLMGALFAMIFGGLGD